MNAKLVEAEQRFNTLHDDANAAIDFCKANRDKRFTVEFSGGELAALLSQTGIAWPTVGYGLVQLDAVNSYIKSGGDDPAPADGDRADVALADGLDYMDRMLSAATTIIAATQTVPDEVPSWMAP